MWNALQETDERYEIWDGEKIVMTPSSPRHESIVSNIHFIIKAYNLEHRAGAVYASNTAVHLDPQSKDFVMPDLTFVSNRNKDIVQANGIYGAPDLVVEVISPGLNNTRRDMVDKYKKYESAGVKEYWLADPIDREIEIYVLQDGRYVQVEESSVLKGIELDKDKIFAEDFQV